MKLGGKKDPYYVVTDGGAIAWVGVFAGLLIAFIGAFFLSIFTSPAFSFWSWLFSGLAISLACSAPIAAYWYLRGRTRGLDTGNHSYQAAHLGEGPKNEPEYIHTTSRAIDEGAVRGVLPASDQEEVAAALAYLAKGGAEERTGVLTLGGIYSSYVGSPYGGQQGLLLFTGDLSEYSIDLDTRTCIPFMEDIVDHSKAHDAVVWAKHRNLPTFKDNRTKISYIGAPHPGLVKFLRVSGIAQAIVLQNIGWDPLADRFVDRFVNGVFTSGNPRAEQFVRDAQRDIRKALHDLLVPYLKAQPNLAVAMSWSGDKTETFRQRWLGAESDLAKLQRDLALKDSRIYALEQGATQLAIRRARSFGAPRDVGPAYHQAGEIPAQSEA